MTFSTILSNGHHFGKRHVPLKISRWWHFFQDGRHFCQMLISTDQTVIQAYNLVQVPSKAGVSNSIYLGAAGGLPPKAGGHTAIGAPPSAPLRFWVDKTPRNALKKAFWYSYTTTSWLTDLQTTVLHLLSQVLP